jgi:capsular polysaccharide biosynthesis protein
MNGELLYPETVIRRRPPVNYDDPECRFTYLRMEDTCPACFLHEMRRAFVSPYGMVFKSGRVVPESLYWGSADRWPEGTFYKKILLARFRRIAGPCVVAHSPFYNNYYHWTTEALPRLFSVKDRLHNARVLVGGETQRFHAETVALFDTAGIETIPFTELAFVNELLLPTNTGRFPVHNEKLIADMGAWLRERVAAEPNRSSGPRNVYLARGADKERRLMNEDEVVAMLSRHGFEVVRTEGLSIAEQIRLFAGIKNLVAVHGAGLSNMIYMQPSGFVAVMINEHHRDASFFNLACAMGHDFALLPAKTHGEIHRKAARYDIIADVPKLERYVSRCMK